MKINRQESTDDSPQQLEVVDYRKYIYCRLILVDDRLTNRGLTWQLKAIMITMVLMTSFAFVSILMSTQAKQRLDNLRSFMLEIMVTMSLFNEYVSRRSLTRIHDFMNQSVRNARLDDPEVRFILESSRKQAATHLRAYTIIFSLNYLAMVLSQPLAEWMAGNSWKKLPYPWAFPPSNNEFSFWLLFIFQATGLYFSHCLGMVIMSFSSITIQITAFFDLLLLSIRRIEQRAGARSERDAIYQRAARLAVLREDVITHQQLVRELLSATPHLRNTFFALSVTISMIMACEAYPLIQGNFTLGELIKGVLFLVVQFMCWAQICTRMEIMSDQNTAVFYALYDTPWYESGVEFKKLIHMAQTFSKHPMYIKSRVFIDMSATMSTFYSFVVSSFNMLNLIRKVN